MQQLYWFFLPPAWWWWAASALSALLVAGSAWGLVRRIGFDKNMPLAHANQRFIALVFVAFSLLWWGFAFAVALWPLRPLDELDDFSQWARASSYVLVPLWIGGVAWAAALLVARFLRMTRTGPNAD